MRKLNLFFVISLMLYSCGGGSDSVVDEVVEDNTSETVKKTDLSGTWCYYSGELQSLLSKEAKDIYNVILELSPSGNLKEHVITYAEYVSSKEYDAYGNWTTANDRLTITNWVGDTIVSEVPFLLVENESLSLKLDGRDIVFLSQDLIKSRYSQLIIGNWISAVRENGMTKTVFEKIGEGYEHSEYASSIGTLYNKENFVWSINKDTLTIHPDWIVGPTGDLKHTINFINQKHFSITELSRGKTTKYYTRE